MLRVSVIGCGYWGPNIIRNLHEIPKCKIRYVCDLDKEKLEKIKQKYPEINITQNSEDIFSDNLTDAVFIATPLHSHYILTKKALISGKSVFVEKPFVEKIEQGEELIEIAEKNKIKLMVGHIFEHSPAVIKIKEIINSGEIGDIYYISSTRVNLGIHRGDGSVIWDLASHDIGIFIYWLEKEPISIQTSGKASIIPNKLDVAFINMIFEPDILTNIHVSWIAPTKLRNMIIVGSKKMIVYDDLAQEKIKIFDKGIDKLEYSSFGEFQLSYRIGDITIPVISNIEPLKAEILHFIDAIENGKKIKTDGYYGLNIVKYLQLAEKSLKEGGKVISLK